MTETVSESAERAKTHVRLIRHAKKGHFQKLVGAGLCSKFKLFRKPVLTKPLEALLNLGDG